jgi:hypothetical protein
MSSDADKDIQEHNMNDERIDPNAPWLVGKVFAMNEAGTELVAPPADQVVVSGPETGVAAESLRCEPFGCDRKVKVSEEGNAKYAWYYLTNSADTYVGVTIERRWVYAGQNRKDTVRHRLYPGQHKEVFSFPRNQNPACCILACAAESDQP